MKNKPFPFKIALVLGSSLLLLAAFNKFENLSETLSGINRKNMDTTVNPGDNFNAYVNGTWMKNTKIPADKASYGAGYMVFEKSQEDVKAIIEASAKGNSANGSDEQKIGDFLRCLYGYYSQK